MLLRKIALSLEIKNSNNNHLGILPLMQKSHLLKLTKQTEESIRTDDLNTKPNHHQKQPAKFILKTPFTVVECIFSIVEIHFSASASMVAFIVYLFFLYCLSPFPSPRIVSARCTQKPEAGRHRSLAVYVVRRGAISPVYYPLGFLIERYNILEVLLKIRRVHIILYRDTDSLDKRGGSVLEKRSDA